MLGRFVVPAAQASQVDASFPLSVIAPDKKSEQAGDIVYTEIPVTADPSGLVRAKIRTGGLTPDAYPSAEALAGFLRRAATARVPFKATAGLHHPLPVPPMHGFVNVFLAAALAWNKGIDSHVLFTLHERNFEFAAEARWGSHRLTAAQIREARTEFAISFGSCSFQEPLADLKELGWL
jgi:hypothetical protein